MNARPKPPEGFDENPALDAAFFARARPAAQNISLTSLGMAVLGTEIDVGGKKEPLSKAVSAVSSGRVDYHRIGDAIGGLIGGVMKSVGG